jgi:hypothetical protein
MRGPAKTVWRKNARTRDGLHDSSTMSRVARARVTRRLKHAFAVTTDARSLLTMLGWSSAAEAGPAIERQELINDARHEADLLRHPYLGPEHVLLAVARRVGDDAAHARLHAAINEGLPSARWRPRGIFSARRARGKRATELAYRNALDKEAQSHSADAPSE